MRRILLSLPVVAFAAALAAGCSTTRTTQPGVVGVDRSQAMLVSSRQVNQSADKQYAQAISQSRQKGTLNHDAAQTERVRAIANRLIAQTAVFRPDATGWRWEVNVITSSQLNAWCMPGGKIAVYSGLIDKLKLTDDELAAIMGHEIAHALREHARERISQQAATSAVVGIGAAALGLGQVGADIGSLLAQVTFTLPNSRTHETEADRIGIELAARAGYDPRAAVSVWQKMAKASEGGPPQFLSTHPSPESRIKDLEVYAQRVMPLYEAARKKQG